jgi:hypothetical protein
VGDDVTDPTSLASAGTGTPAGVADPV